MSIWILINKVLLDYRWACINEMNIPEEVAQESIIRVGLLFTCEMHVRDTLESSRLYSGTTHWGTIFGVPFKDRLELRNKLEIP